MLKASVRGRQERIQVAVCAVAREKTFCANAQMAIAVKARQGGALRLIWLCAICANVVWELDWIMAAGSGKVSWYRRMKASMIWLERGDQMFIVSRCEFGTNYRARSWRGHSVRVAQKVLGGVWDLVAGEPRLAPVYVAGRSPCQKTREGERRVVRALCICGGFDTFATEYTELNRVHRDGLTTENTEGTEGESLGSPLFTLPVQPHPPAPSPAS